MPIEVQDLIVLYNMFIMNMMKYWVVFWHTLLDENSCFRFSGLRDSKIPKSGQAMLFENLLRWVGTETDLCLTSKTLVLLIQRLELR